MNFGLSTKFFLALLTAHLVRSADTVGKSDPFLAALRDNNHAKLLELGREKTQSCDLSDDFYKLAFCKCSHQQYAGSEICEAVLDVVKLVDLFNCLERHSGEDDLEKSVVVGNTFDVILADDLMEEMFADSLKCKFTIKNDPNQDDSDLPFYVEADADSKMALVMHGTGKLADEMMVFLSTTMAYLATLPTLANPIPLIKHAILKCHEISRKLLLRGTCKLVVSVVWRGRLHVVYVGRPKIVLKAADGNVLFETVTSIGRAWEERLSGELETVMVRTYESVSMNVRAGQTLTVSMANDGDYEEAIAQKAPQVSFTFS